MAKVKMGRWPRGAMVMALVTGTTFLSGWQSPGYSFSSSSVGMVGSALVLSLPAGVDTGVPPRPVPLVLPDTPIVVSRTRELGYLPGTDSVTPGGQFTYTIPVEVPAGRAGMQPSLSLNYVSGGGNGILGVGWSLGGTSAITRCAQTLATEGTVRGVHYTDFTKTPEPQRDRFCLDGQKLVAIHGSYGQDGTEYRTEADSYAQIISTQDAQQPHVAGALIFTVKTKGGRTRVYSGMSGSQSLTGLNQSSPTAFAGAAWWAVSDEMDEAGNGIHYNYTPLVQASPTSWGSTYPQLQQWQLSSIVYTTSTDGSDKGHRQVTFAYEDRPDTEFGFQAGIGSALFQRLKSITLSAPNPAKTVPVWQYLLSYQATPSSFSGRSLLASVQRCAMTPTGGPGGCTWSKTFDWSSAGAGAKPVFNGKWQTLASVNQWPIGGLRGLNDTPNPLDPLGNYVDSDANSYPFSGLWPDNPPLLQVLDVDGDGKDDVLFQDGGTPGVYLLTTPATAPAVSATNLLSSLVQFGAGAYQPAADKDNRQSLQNVVPIDVDGDGASEIFVTQATVNTVHNPETVTCQSKALQWKGAATGFVDMGLNLPTYACRNPYAASQTHLFLDLNGDHLLDHLQANQADLAPVGGPGGAPGNNNSAINVVPGPWQLAQLNTQHNSLGATGNPPGGLFAACPSYVVDFSGDGHGQLFGQGGYTGAEAYTSPLNGQTTYFNGMVHCGGVTGTLTTLDSYDPIAGVWQESTNATDNPLYPVIPGSYGPATAEATVTPQVPGIPGLGTSPGLIFGDFNGDGLEDVIEPDQDPAQAANGVMWLRWNTGNGFGPRIALGSHLWAQANPEADPNVNGGPFLGSTAQSTFYKVYVTDINHDGRADLVVFGNYFTPGITVELSNGDGSFTTMYIPDAQTPNGQADAGVITDVGQVTGVIGDFNGDGYTDILRLELANGSIDGQPFLAAEGNDPSRAGSLQVLTQTPAINDRITAVFDEPTAWPRVAVTYDLQWSDKPETVAACGYPQYCGRRGSAVVRELDRYDTWVDPVSAQTPHQIFYSYEDPVSDLLGRGALGFRKVREWDPTQLRQTTTLYDNRTAVTGIYAGAMRPQSVTTVIAIPPVSSPQTLPSLLAPGKGAVDSNARVSQTIYTNTLLPTLWPTQASTYVIQPQTQVTSEWEQPIKLVASVKDAADPTSDYMWPLVVPVPPAQPLRVHTTNFDAIDAFGNVTQSTDTTTGGVSSVSRSSYDNVCAYAPCNVTAAAWQIGLLRTARVTVTEADPAEVPVTRQTSYDYDAKGLLQTVHEQQVVSSTSTPTEVRTTTVTRDAPTGPAYGLVTKTSVRALGADGQWQTREVHTGYGPSWSGQPDERVFPSQTWTTTPYADGISLPSAWTAVHPAYGVVSAAMDVNGVQGTNSYDDQGRLVASASAGQAPMTISYAGRPDQGVYGSAILNGLVATSHVGGQVSSVSVDAGGRPIGTSHLDVTGAVTRTSTRYDLLGRRVSTSRPYQGAAPVYQDSVTYDGLGRMLMLTAPDATVTKFAPTFFTATTVANSSTDPQGYQRKVTTDVDGRTIASAEWFNGDGTWLTTRYHYAPFNLPDAVTDPKGNVETTSYDSLGRILGGHTPDGGTLALQYDGFDELLQSSHVESGYMTTYTYDALGRVTGWKNPEGPNGLTSASFTFDTQPYGLGKPAATLSSDNVTTLSHYDQYGRSVAMDETVEGVTYTVGASYDSEGRPSQMTYPALGSNPHPGLTLTYAYAPTEYLSEVDYQTAVPGSNALTSVQPLWSVSSRTLDDAVLVGQFGKQVATLQNTYTAANGQLQEIKATAHASSAAAFDLRYQYYPNGLVNTRTDTVNGRLDTFGYDSLNRLTSWSLSRCASPPCTASAASGNRSTYGYDPTGNLIQGAYSATLNGALTVTQANSYGGGGAQGGPHALSMQNSTSYSYDTQGRQIAGGGTGRKLTYNAFHLPATVTNNGAIWTFKYNALGERVEKSGVDGTTIYIGGVYEHRVRSDGNEDAFQVPGLAQVVVNKAVTTTQYVLTDGLGSSGAVMDVVNGVIVPSAVTGKATTPFFYEPFGSRINLDGSVFAGSLDKLTKGFTGQEHEEDIGLINFRGRMYDPQLKRFLSPDPVGGGGQRQNPYSYVNNSPLNAVDPSGYNPDCVATPGGANDYECGTNDEPAPAPGTGGVAPPLVQTLPAMSPDALSGQAGAPLQSAADPSNGVASVGGNGGPSTIGPPTLDQWQDAQTAQTAQTNRILDKYRVTAKSSPTLEKTLKYLDGMGINVEMKDKLDCGKCDGETDLEGRRIFLAPNRPYGKEGGVLAHEVNHMDQFDHGRNKGDSSAQTCAEYFAACIANETEAFTQQFKVYAELIYTGVVKNVISPIPKRSKFDKGTLEYLKKRIELNNYAAAMRAQKEDLDPDVVESLAHEAAGHILSPGTTTGEWYRKFYEDAWFEAERK